jgi:hypothetical protein
MGDAFKADCEPLRRAIVWLTGQASLSLSGLYRPTHDGDRHRHGFTYSTGNFDSQFLYFCALCVLCGYFFVPVRLKPVPSFEEHDHAGGYS